MSDSFVRATSLLVGGIVIGLSIGLALPPARHSTSNVSQSGNFSSAALATNPRTKSVSRLDSETEHPNILLGNIVTVPFQELYAHARLVKASFNQFIERSTYGLWGI